MQMVHVWRLSPAILVVGHTRHALNDLKKQQACSEQDSETLIHPQIYYLMINRLAPKRGAF